jgi:Bacterial Ig-like domain (group 1)
VAGLPQTGMGRYPVTFAMLLVAGAFAALVGIPIGNWGGSGASAAYYYYSGGGPASLSLAPTSATNPVGTSHTVTATVTQGTNPLTGVAVRFTISGSVSLGGSCTTDTNGVCTFTYSGPQFPGNDTITAFADVNGNGTRDSDEPTATATKTWVLPASTPGSASGDGQILVGTDVVTFSFSAKSSGTAFQGSCTVIDRDTKRKIMCRDVTAFVESGKQATFYGHALDNGVATSYKISVVDNGKPGTTDTFSITTASGYSASGTLTSGNVQVR